MSGGTCRRVLRTREMTKDERIILIERKRICWWRQSGRSSRKQRAGSQILKQCSGTCGNGDDDNWLSIKRSICYFGLFSTPRLFSSALVWSIFLSISFCVTGEFALLPWCACFASINTSNLLLSFRLILGNREKETANLRTSSEPYILPLFVCLQVSIERGGPRWNRSLYQSRSKTQTSLKPYLQPSIPLFLVTFSSLTSMKNIRSIETSWSEDVSNDGKMSAIMALIRGEWRERARRRQAHILLIEGRVYFFKRESLADVLLVEIIRKGCPSAE